MRSIIKKYPIASFLVINYLISWSFLYPSYQMILEHEGITPLSLIGLIGAYGPTLAAIIVQRIVAPDQLRAMFQKLIQLQAGLGTYLFVIFMPILLYTIAYAAGLLFYHEPLYLFKGALSSIPLFLLLALPFGPMGEELGWRGFMLPRLLEKHGPLQSSILVGLAWGIWHLASFTFPGAALPTFLPVSIGTIGLYFLNTIAQSTVYTYVFMKSKGSVALAILLHAFFNTADSMVTEFLPATENVNVEVIGYAGNILLVGTLGVFLLYRNR